MSKISWSTLVAIQEEKDLEALQPKFPEIDSRAEELKKLRIRANQLFTEERP
jgi:hypothetical protein